MFVAIAHFDQKRFWKLNLIGGAAWVGLLMLAGYLLGEIPFVAHNVELFALGFVVISSLPLPFELAREAIKRRKKARG
jgi:membrane-associated protein